MSNEGFKLTAYFLC